MALQLTNNVDEEFAVCLDNLESSEAPRRRQAIAGIERLGGIRALQIATALTSDTDLVVATSARRICSVLSKKGLMLRRYTATQPLAQTVAIKSFWQLLDEVVFIIRRNLAGIVVDSFLFSIPKLSAVTIFFIAPFFASIQDLLSEPPFVNLLMLAYQIFWRPLVWQSTGLAFLAGFPENAYRRRSRKAGGWELYNSLMKAGIPEAILYSLLLIPIYNSYFSRFTSDLPLLALIVFTWLICWHISVYLPFAIIFDQPVKMKSIWSFRYMSDFWLSIKFGMLLILLYLIVFGGAVSSLWLFGLDNWLNNPRLIASGSFGFFIVADVLIDPLVIGYRLLLAKINQDSKQ